MNGICISEKHGVNPCIPICFWCGKEKPGEIALLGKLAGDKEAPMTAIIDYDPCDECQQNMKLGISFIEVTEKPVRDNQAPIQKNPVPLYPTGRWFVLKERAVEMFSDEKVKKDILEKRRCYIDEETYNSIYNQISPKKEGE